MHKSDLSGVVQHTVGYYRVFSMMDLHGVSQVSMGLYGSPLSLHGPPWSLHDSLCVSMESLRLHGSLCVSMGSPCINASKIDGDAKRVPWRLDGYPRIFMRGYTRLHGEPRLYELFCSGLSMKTLDYSNSATDPYHTPTPCRTAKVLCWSHGGP